VPENDKAVSPLTDEQLGKRGWGVRINGEVRPDVRSIDVENAEIGWEFYYGMRPEGHDGIVFRERKGGGSVVLPYTWWDGQIFVGVLLEDRFLQGGRVPNAPRGALDEGETHIVAAERELREELEDAGISRDQVGPIEELFLGGVNPFPSIVDTRGDQEGNHFFAAFVDPARLYKTGGVRTSWLEFREFTTRPLYSGKSHEQIHAFIFVRWDSFILAGDPMKKDAEIDSLGPFSYDARDGLTVTAVAVLLAHLHTRGLIKISFT